MLEETIVSFVYTFFPYKALPVSCLYPRIVKLALFNNIEYLNKLFVFKQSLKKYYIPTITCKKQLTIASIKDQPYQFCCHLGIQSLSFPRTPKVITAITKNNAFKIKVFCIIYHNVTVINKLIIPFL